jgi:hypothetical protein
VATITSAQSGNFSDTATWVGGVVPGVGDVAVAATGHVIVIDVDVTVDEVDQAGTGKFTLGNGRTLTANVTARAGTFTSGGTVEVVVTTGNTARIVGDISGVSTTAASIAGVVMSGTGRLEIEGNITGSAGNVSAAADFNAMLYVSGAGEVEVDGNLTGGSGQRKFAVQIAVPAIFTLNGNIFAGNNGQNTVTLVNEGAGTIAIFGNIDGGNFPGTGGFQNNAASTISIVGNLEAKNPAGTGRFALRNDAAATITILGNVLAGIGVEANAFVNTGAATINVTGTLIADNGNAINNNNASAVISVTGELIPSTGANAINSSSVTNLLTGPFRVASNGRHAVIAPGWQWLNVSIPGEFEVKTQDLTETRTLFTADVLPGVPAATDVRSGVTYGPLGEITGTCAVPPPTAVASGVPVDATTGEAVLRQADAAAIFGAIWEQG